MVFTDGNVLTASQLNAFEINTIDITSNTVYPLLDINSSYTGFTYPLFIVTIGAGGVFTIEHTSTANFIKCTSVSSVVFEVDYQGNMDMYDNYISNVDNVLFTNKTSAPSTVEGKLYYDSTNGLFYVYNGTGWEYLGV